MKMYRALIFAIALYSPFVMAKKIFTELPSESRIRKICLKNKGDFYCKHISPALYCASCLCTAKKLDRDRKEMLETYCNDSGLSEYWVKWYINMLLSGNGYEPEEIIEELQIVFETIKRLQKECREKQNAKNTKG